MKRCPKCNRAYSTDTQKFCTHDGGLLFTVDDDLGQTVKFDSSKVRDDVSKPTTRNLPGQAAAAFDPEATVVSSKVGEGTQAVKPRDTGNLERPPQTQYYGAPPSAPPTGPVSPPQAAPPPPQAAPPPPAQAAPPPPAQAAPPPTQVVSSGPIAPATGPIPPPAQAAAAAQTSQPLPPTVAKKKSKLPLILGILAVLIIFFVGASAVAGYFLWWKPRQERAAEPVVTTEPTQTEPSLPTTTSTPIEASIPSNEPPPYNPPADAVLFVNSQEALSGKLAENFVAFSFYYPNRWVKVPAKENFVTVERRLPPDFTQERFGVAPWYAPADMTTFDNDFFQTLVAKDDANFAKNYPEYRKVSEGPIKVGTYDGYELRFESTSRGTDKGDLTIWGREILFPPREGEKAGIKFLILTTSLAPELKSIDDVGTKGELPMLLESFRFGK